MGRHFSIAGQGGRSLKATLLRRQQTRVREFWAVRNVDLDVAPGESFGVVGRNGSGKSTLLKMLARIYGPSEGACQVGGRLSSLLELGAGFHPEFSAIENIYLSAAIYGIPREEVRRDVEGIIDFAELDDFKDQPVKTFSSGMFARLGFSVAMHVRPDVLLLDEVLAVGDEAFVQKCMGRIADYRRGGGTMMLVSHSPETIERMCERALYLERGVPVMTGPAHDVITAYHERLAAEDTSRGIAAGVAHADAVTAHVEIVDAGGATRHRFTEGESISIRMRLLSSIEATSTRVAVTIRDELDREIGTTWCDGVALAEGAKHSLTAHLPQPPLRAGQFPVDISITDTFTGRTFLECRSIESISILGQKADSSGPVQLSADWSCSST